MVVALTGCVVIQPVRDQASSEMAAVPKELRHGPFVVADARRIGLKWDVLQSKDWRRLSRGQYSWSGLRHDVDLRLRAVEHRMPPTFAFSGPTSGWLHEQDMQPCEPIEVTVDRDIPVHARAGVRVRRSSLPEQDVVVVRGFRTTSPLRTVRDLGSRGDLVESVVAVDMVLHSELIDLPSLRRYVELNPGTKGIKRLRRAVDLAEPASESPMETRLRLVLIKARLPRPAVQVDLHDGSGRFLCRADLYYPDVRLVIEFDGQNHRERLTQDMRRQNGLINAGFHVLRFTTADLLLKDFVATQVRQARKALLR